MDFVRERPEINCHIIKTLT